MGSDQDHRDQVEASRQSDGRFGNWPASESGAQLSGDERMRSATGVPDGVNPLAGTGSLAYPPPIESTADAIHFGSTVEVSDQACSRVLDTDDAAHRQSRVSVRETMVEQARKDKVDEKLRAMKKPLFKRQWVYEHDTDWLVRYKDVPRFWDRAKNLSDSELELRPEIGRTDVQSVVRSYAMVANAPKAKAEDGSVGFADPDQLYEAQLMCDGQKQSVVEIYDTYLSGRKDLMDQIKMPRRDPAEKLDAMVDQLRRITNNTADTAYNTARSAQANAEQLEQQRQNSWLLRAGVSAQMHINRDMRALRGYADAADSRRLGHNQPMDTLRRGY